MIQRGISVRFRRRGFGVLTLVSTSLVGICFIEPTLAIRKTLHANAPIAGDRANDTFTWVQQSRTSKRTPKKRPTTTTTTTIAANNSVPETIDIPKMKSISKKTPATVKTANGGVVHDIEYDYSTTVPSGARQEFSGNDTTGYVIKERQPDSFLVIYKEFYRTGVLKRKGELFSRFQKGIWRNYDEAGNLTKETNYETGYAFTLDDLLKLAETKQIKLDDKRNSIRRADTTTDENKSPVWRLEWAEPNLPQTNVLEIDGTDGKIIKQSFYSCCDA